MASPSRTTTRSTLRTSPGFGGDTQPAGGTDQRESGLRPGAGHFERHGTAGFGQRAVCQECSAPRGNAVTEAAAHHLCWETAGRPAVRVDEAGLPASASPSLITRTT